MIKTAVDQRPNDGYIVDSLGWAYYRLGRYPEAVTALERAVEAVAGGLDASTTISATPTGQVGRKREATFQWAHARDLDPEPDGPAEDPGEARARPATARSRPLPGAKPN